MPEEKNETTNAVLREMIIGLTKITDDRLLNLKEGIAEIKLLMSGLATKTEVEEVKKDFTATIKRMEGVYIKMQEEYVKHNQEDMDNFSEIRKGQQGSDKAIEKWKNICIGVSLIGSPILTIGIAWVISLFVK